MLYVCTVRVCVYLSMCVCACVCALRACVVYSGVVVHARADAFGIVWNSMEDEDDFMVGEVLEDLGDFEEVRK